MLPSMRPMPRVSIPIIAERRKANAPESPLLRRSTEATSPWSPCDSPEDERPDQGADADVVAARELRFDRVHLGSPDVPNVRPPDEAPVGTEDGLSDQDPEGERREPSKTIAHG